MTGRLAAVLVIDDDPKGRGWLSNLLDGIVEKILWTGRSSGITRLLGSNSVKAILVTLSWDKLAKFDLISSLRRIKPAVPIIVISETKNDVLAARVLKEGAQDVLVKGQFDREVLARTLYFSMERQRVVEKLQIVSMYDELTGVYNRRGWLALAQQQLQVAERTNKKMALFFVDLDSMKLINDTFGHQAGDEALIRAADLLHSTFRRSDIIGRFGGDEFVILSLDVNPEFSQTMLVRLAERQCLDKRQPQLPLSIGVAYYDPEKPANMEELLAEADKRMYEDKRRKKDALSDAKPL
ncbi:MAG: diguanylate cyclase response regulator [Veillonellales bacterium]